MQEILFRGKRNGYADQQDRDWLEGSLFVGDNGECEICYGTPRVRITYSVIPETVGQYTGLTDKNGKKIFEGDILGYEKIRGAVEYDCIRGLYRFVWKNYDKSRNDFLKQCTLSDFGYYDSLEVIGNIYDNPELLKGE